MMIIFTYIFMIITGIIGRTAVYRYIRNNNDKLDHAIVIIFAILWALAFTGLLLQTHKLYI